MEQSQCTVHVCICCREADVWKIHRQGKHKTLKGSTGLSVVWRKVNRKQDYQYRKTKLIENLLWLFLGPQLFCSRAEELQRGHSEAGRDRIWYWRWMDEETVSPGQTRSAVKPWGWDWRRSGAGHLRAVPWSHSHSSVTICNQTQ